MSEKRLEPLTFTVKRSEWLRGCHDPQDRPATPYLLSYSGNRCCMGFYAAARGVNDAFMRGCGELITVGLNLDSVLLTPNGDPNLSPDPNNAYSINDSRVIDDATREQLLTELLDKHGITVNFED